jgi:hypothetical protein
MLLSLRDDQGSYNRHTFFDRREGVGTVSACENFEQEQICTKATSD